MRESKMHDLSKGKWAGKEGQDALHLFFELVGLDSSTDDSDLSQEAVKVKDAQIVRYIFYLCVQLNSVTLETTASSPNCRSAPSISP
jgi:hypothetical protein